MPNSNQYDKLKSQIRAKGELRASTCQTWKADLGAVWHLGVLQKRFRVSVSGKAGCVGASLGRSVEHSASCHHGQGVQLHAKRE